MNPSGDYEHDVFKRHEQLMQIDKFAQYNALALATKPKLPVGLMNLDPSDPEWDDEMT